ncbi:hypothetical protein B0T14DRAFT_570459 [Immersiella caudata]|uniref:Uncharacterized protein n=1 Tax=Immersiella caudata TaxID=314043 RepID=A0AA39WFN0_9PEZI|nr:hypothetical protein B0T14DRAFT_570459 [Immersiella caudata]
MRQRYTLPVQIGGAGDSAPTLFQKPLHRQRWYDVAKQYSLRYRGFSYPADVLSALSGTASLFSRKFNIPEGEYVAGLWRDSDRLFCDLAWEITGSTSQRPGSLAELVKFLDLAASPSWAWPGKGCIRFRALHVAESGLVTPACSLGISTVVKGKDAFGQVDTGVVRITAMTSALTSDLERGNPGGFDIERNQPHWMLQSLHPPRRRGDEMQPSGSRRLRSWRLRLDWAPEDMVVSCEGLEW